MKSKARLQNYEKMQSETVKEKEAKLEIFIPNGQRLGDKVIEFKKVTKGFGDRLLFEDSQLRTAARGHRGHHRSERRRQDHALPHDHGRGESRQRHRDHRRHRADRLRGPEPQGPDRREDRVGGGEQRRRSR